MADRVQALRELAVGARNRGASLKAAAAYRELETLQPEEPMWPKGLAECLEHHGDHAGAVPALERAAMRYAARGFVVRAIATHKMILRRVPDHKAALDAIVELQGQRVTGLARIRRRSQTDELRVTTLETPMHDEVEGGKPAVAISSGVYEVPLEPVRERPSEGAELDALASAPMFARLSPESLRLVVDAAALVELSEGEVLFRRGDPASSMYMIVDGRVSLSSNVAEGPAIADLGPGEVLGVVGLVSAAARSVGAIAREPTRLLEIPRSSVDALFLTAPDLRDALLDLARQRLLAVLLATHPLFCRFETPVRDALADRFRFFEVTVGARLVDVGSPPNHLFVVMTGRLEVIGIDGEVVAALGTGSLAAESEFLSRAPVVLPIIARARAFVLGLPYGDFYSLASTHPGFLEELTREANAPVWDPALVS